jgi:hypothetical protein
LVNVEVAAAVNCADVDASMVNVPVVEAAAPKLTDLLVFPAPEVLEMVRLLNALVPVIVPERIFRFVLYISSSQLTLLLDAQSKEELVAVPMYM